MSGAHTPGRFVCHSGSVYRAEPVDNDGYAVVRLALMDRDTPETTPAERDANARFFAAAPAMLEALEGVVVLADTVGWTEEDHIAAWDAARQALEDAGVKP